MQGEFRPMDPELGNPRLDENPELKAVVEKADAIVKEAQLNHAIEIIDGLLNEVDEMHVANRFSRDRKIKENIIRSPAKLSHFEEMTEEQFKREQLRLDLRKIRTEVVSSVGKLKSVVLDMEATKRDTESE